MSSNEAQTALYDLDVVMLRQDITRHGLARGQKGTIVHRYAESEAFEVEFHRPGDEPVVVTLHADQVRKVWDAATRQHVGKPPATIEWE